MFSKHLKLWFTFGRRWYILFYRGKPTGQPQTERQDTMDNNTYAGIIEGVSALYAENESLRREVAELTAKLKCRDAEGNDYTARLLEAGRDAILEDALAHWHKVYLADPTDPESAHDGYEDWLRNSLCCIPSQLSRDEFLREFEGELTGEYERDLAKAQEDARG